MLLHDAVAILSTILALGIALHAWRQHSFGIACLSAWMTTLAATAWVIVAGVGADGRLSPLARLLVPLLSTPAGPLLYGYVLHATRGRRLSWAWFLPAAAHLAAALALGTALNARVSLNSVIWLEYALLIVAWGVWVRTGAGKGERIASGLVLVAASALALANLAQTLAVFAIIDFTAWVRQAPFVVVCSWVVAALGFALYESPAFRRLAPPLVPAPARADHEVFERISRLMAEQRAWSDPDFNVATLARLADTPPNAISRALSRAGDTNFYDFVNGYRLREAERLLADPRESRLKVEALGRQAGFRARSTFFKLFRQHTGLTPSEYRAGRNASTDA